MNTQKKILCIQHRENDIKRKLKKSTDKKVWGVNGKMRVKKEEKKSLRKDIKKEHEMAHGEIEIKGKGKWI